MFFGITVLQKRSELVGEVVYIISVTFVVIIY